LGVERGIASDVKVAAAAYGVPVPSAAVFHPAKV